MIAVVTGSRSITDYELVSTVLDRCWFDISELWHGAQPGVKVNSQWLDTVDLLAARWAKENSIPVKPFPADWDRHGKPAGPIRNQAMADAAAPLDSFLVKIWDGTSTGTADCSKRFAAIPKPIYEYNRQTGKFAYYGLR